MHVVPARPSLASLAAASLKHAPCSITYRLANVVAVFVAAGRLEQQLRVARGHAGQGGRECGAPRAAHDIAGARPAVVAGVVELFVAADVVCIDRAVRDVNVPLVAGRKEAPPLRGARGGGDELQSAATSLHVHCTLRSPAAASTWRPEWSFTGQASTTSGDPHGLTLR